MTARSRWCAQRFESTVSTSCPPGRQPLARRPPASGARIARPGPLAGRVFRYGRGGTLTPSPSRPADERRGYGHSTARPRLEHGRGLRSGRWASSSKSYPSPLVARSRCLSSCSCLAARHHPLQLSGRPQRGTVHPRTETRVAECRCAGVDRPVSLLALGVVGASEGAPLPGRGALALVLVCSACSYPTAGHHPLQLVGYLHDGPRTRSAGQPAHRAGGPRSARRHGAGGRGPALRRPDTPRRAALGDLLVPNRDLAWRQRRARVQLGWPTTPERQSRPRRSKGEKPRREVNGPVVRLCHGDSRCQGAAI